MTEFSSFKSEPVIVAHLPGDYKMPDSHEEIKTAPQPRFAVLACFHTIRFRPPYPNIGSEVYCWACRESSTIERMIGEYYVKCRNRKCHWTQGYGLSRPRARRAMNDHFSKNSSHRIDIWQSGKILETFPPENQTILF